MAPMGPVSSPGPRPQNREKRPSNIDRQVPQHSARAVCDDYRVPTCGHGLPVKPSYRLAEKGDGRGLRVRSWSDCNGDVEQCFTKDELLTDVMLYWATGAINASFWPRLSHSGIREVAD